MHRFFLLFILGIELVALVGCSLQKRRYRHGFYVAARSSAKKAHESHVSHHLKTPDISPDPLDKIHVDPIRPLAKIISASAGLQEYESRSIVVKNIPLLQGFAFKPLKISLPDTSDTHHKVVPRAAVTSFVFGILSDLTAFAVGLAIVANNPAVGLVIGALGWFVILGIVLGVRALNKRDKEPEKYKGLGLAFAGIILCLAFFLFIGLGIILG